MNNPELINLYIENLMNEVTEGTKARVLLQTQLKYTELMNTQLQSKITELETQLEKLNKKKVKEVDNF
jgi:septal ring factor EnvC (AmiA/AmiB activator)